MHSSRVSQAEKINADDGSVELVTACQAAHWFDLPAFYREVHRVLVPNGVLALYGYECPGFVTGDVERDEKLDARLLKVKLSVRLGMCHGLDKLFFFLVRFIQWN